MCSCSLSRHVKKGLNDRNEKPSSRASARYGGMLLHLLEEIEGQQADTGDRRRVEGQTQAVHPLRQHPPRRCHHQCITHHACASMHAHVRSPHIHSISPICHSQFRSAHTMWPFPQNHQGRTAFLSGGSKLARQMKGPCRMHRV